MNSVSFRRADAHDAALLTKIAFAGKQHWNYPAAWMELWRHDLAVTPYYLRSEPVQVAEKEGEIIGFTGLSSEADGRHLEHLWLWPKYIGQGFGRALFEESVQLAHGEGTRELLINSDPNAESFYLKRGGVRIGQEIYELPGGIRREIPLLVYRLR